MSLKPTVGLVLVLISFNLETLMIT